MQEKSFVLRMLLVSVWWYFDFDRKATIFKIDPKNLVRGVSSENRYELTLVGYRVEHEWYWQSENDYKAIGGHTRK